MKHSAHDLSDLSARNRRILALGVRGADGDDPAAELDALLARVDGIADLNDDDLDTLVEELRAEALARLETPSDESIADADRILAAIDTIETAQTERETAAADLATAAAERIARLRGEDPAADPDADPAADPDPDADPAPSADADPDADPAADPDADPAPSADADDPEAEPLAASGADRLPVATRVAARRPPHTRPHKQAKRDVRTVLMASANSPKVQAGTALDTPERIMEAFASTARATQGYKGGYMQFPVASLGVFDASELYGEERTLRHDARGNEARIAAVTSEQALRASGGICAPPPIQYDLPTIGTDARPVRDALARFGADRGGVRLLPPPQLTDVDDAIGIWTEANDISLDDPETKPCLELDCPEEVETLVDAITRCLKVGNFRNRYFPEQVAAWVTKVGQQFARRAEIKALQKIGGESIQVTAGERILGTTRDVLRALDLATARQRSLYRLPQDYPVRVIAPMWLLNNMVSDLSAEQPGSTDERLMANVALIESFFTSRKVNVTWTLDGEAGQIFGAQNDGAIVRWPNQVVLYMFLEGEWLHLDGGTLDFGIVRDSSLNATNDFQMFSEGFENQAFHGAGDTIRLKIDICPSGATSAAVDASELCTIGS